jgi:transcription antitermination protein NusB
LAGRRKAREHALQILYQIEITHCDPVRTLAQYRTHFLTEPDPGTFLDRIVAGVIEHRGEIDGLIERISEHWRIERMGSIDLAVLRLAVFELLFCPDIPPKVTLNEAVDLAKRFGSEESGVFVNGVLDRIQNEVVRKPDLPAQGLD